LSFGRDGRFPFLVLVGGPCDLTVSTKNSK
jgi:hypothetical protein